ncbi:MAG: 1,4-dihydroxy-6-naphthoate synthase [Desulfuromonadales bacterium]|nr:1,4-dihydroxy-6-naphthoate synthase [Desulfuromonadales bacterium]
MKNGNHNSETETLSLGFSPCPNDTFIFHALVHNIIKAGNLAFNERLEDVETLNQLALSKELDVTKVSSHMVGHLLNDYCLLTSGGALGRGCGPLLISKKNYDQKSLQKGKIAVPGKYTTACLLLRLFNPELKNLVFIPFDKIMPAIQSEEVSAGVIIHESRFTYQNLGLVKIVDLGEWWENYSGLPIPLGGIVAKRSLGEETIHTINRGIQESISYAFNNPEASKSYIRSHSQEMSEDVCNSHIGLYVNQFSKELGDEGKKAVEMLLEKAFEYGIIPAYNRHNIFSE